MSFGRLFALFLIVPVLDLALLVTVGGRIGFWPTLGIVIATALAGSWLARREGLAAWRRVQKSMTGGAAPGEAVLDGLVILIAGTLLLTPGFLTDIVGLIGLIPASRRVLRKVLAGRFKAGLASGAIRTASFGGGMGGGFGGASPTSGSPFGGFGTPAVEDAEVLSDVVLDREEPTPAVGRAGAVREGRDA